VFEAILAGLRDEPLELIVTVGSDGDPAALGPQPDNVHVERFLPQGALLPLCDLVVSYCGSGAMLGTLGAGLPMLALPQGADQFLNAGRITATGTGLALMPEEATPAAIREAAAALLTDASVHTAARALQGEIEAMPAPATLIDGLEALVAAAGTDGNHHA
jgi:UDP:flavonoid glycosyltransferase YjiC (YdhE family)